MSSAARERGAWAAAVVGYLVLAVVLTWPLVGHLGDWALGYPSPDNMDTAQLRRVVAMGLDADGSSTELFAPVGYPARALMPNLLDHWTAAPLVRWLPWPLADNLWWLAVLALNGIAGHVLGRSLGGDHRRGLLCGVAMMCAEPILREANLGHAPQAMAFTGPLVVLGLARALRPDGHWRDGLLLGGAMAVAGLTYWYAGVFLGALCLPVVLAACGRSADRPGLRWVVLGAGVCLGLVAVPAATALGGWDQLAMTDRGMLPDLGDPALEVLPVSERFVFTQSGHLDWIFSTTPADRSSRVGVALLAAAVWGTRASPQRRWRWWAAAGLGGVLLMGSFLGYDDAPVTLGGRPIALPWYWIAQVSPVLERLHWPQRWAVVVPLALLPLAARCPRPLPFAAALVLETLLVSQHAPLAHTPTAHLDGWRALAALPADRSVLVVPMSRSHDQTALLGYAYRAAEHPLVAQTRLPSGAVEPAEWWAWAEASGYLHPARGEGAGAAALAEAGVGAVALDTTPGGYLHPRRYDTVRRQLASLTRELGPPVDYGSVQVWWVTPPDPVPAALPDPDAWREARFRDLAAENAALEDDDYAAMPWNVPVIYRKTSRSAPPR